MAQFSVFGPNHTPLARRSIPTSQPLNPGLPSPKYVPSTQLRGPPRFVHFLAQIPPPPHISPPLPPSPSTPAYPAPNMSPLSIDDTPHAQFLKAKPLRLSILFSLHFWSIAPIFAFSTIHQLVFAPVYILLLLHMHVHHQYTILGVQFRCVIS